MIVSAYGFAPVLGPNVVLDPSRVAAQVVSGIGFLGAGAILARGEIIKGLTTAASIWTVAAIGLAVGGGVGRGGAAPGRGGTGTGGTGKQRACCAEPKRSWCWSCGL